MNRKEEEKLKNSKNQRLQVGTKRQQKEGGVENVTYTSLNSSKLVAGVKTSKSPITCRET